MPLQELQSRLDDVQRVADSETKLASQVQALEDAIEDVIEVTSETKAILSPWMDERLVSATMQQPSRVTCSILVGVRGY